MRCGGWRAPCAARFHNRISSLLSSHSTHQPTNSSDSGSPSRPLLGVASRCGSCRGVKAWVRVGPPGDHCLPRPGRWCVRTAPTPVPLLFGPRSPQRICAPSGCLACAVPGVPVETGHNAFNKYSESHRCRFHRGGEAWPHRYNLTDVPYNLVFTGVLARETASLAVPPERMVSITGSGKD